jgi:TPR repeat protein
VLVSLVALGAAPAQSKKADEWSAACEQGQARDCHELARAHLRGRERLARDANEAARFYQRACELGAAAACQEYGEALLVGAEGLALDSAMAADVLGRGCELEPAGKSGGTIGIGGRNRCQSIIELYRQGPPRSREDSVTAKRVTVEACNRAKNQVACVLLDAGWRAFPDSIPLPDAVKQAIAEEAARRARLDSIRVADSVRRVQDSIAAVVRARQREDSLRRAADLERSRTSQRDALRRGTLKANCDAGDAQSCATLADWMQRGRGGPVDPAGAQALRKRACELDPRFCRPAAGP